MFSYNFACTIMKRSTLLKESKESFYSTKNPPVINLKGKLRKPLDFFSRCQTCCIWLAHLFIDMLEPYMKVLILSVVHVPPEKRPTEKRNCRKIIVALNDS